MSPDDIVNKVASITDSFDPVDRELSEITDIFTILHITF